MKAKASKECAKRSKKAKQACIRSPKKRRQGTPKKRHLLPPAKVKDTGVLETENESKSVKGVCKAKQESEASLRKKPQKEEAGYTPKKKRHLLPPAKVKDARVLEKRENESKSVKGVCKAKQESEASLRKKPQKEEAWYLPQKKRHLLPPAKVKDARVLEKQGRMKAKESKECVKRSKKAKQACVRSPKKRRQGTPQKKTVTCYHLPRWRMPACLKKRENESQRAKGARKAKQESEASLRKKPQKEEAGYPPQKKHHATTCQGEGCPRAWKKGEWKQKSQRSVQSEARKRSKPAQEAPKRGGRVPQKKKRHLLPPAKVKDARVLEKKGEWKQKSQRSVQSEARKRSKPAQEAPKRGGKVPQKKHHPLPPAKVKDARVLEKKGEWKQKSQRSV